MAQVRSVMPSTSDTSQLDPVLVTKLYIPRTSHNLVPRPRLIDRLNAGLHCKLTLVSAPAGFGKTTLLGEWVAGRGQITGWVSLDEGDNDPARFWAYLIAALQMVEASVGESAQSALQASQPPPIESVLTSLINEIAAVVGPLVLVLDDYHLITAQPIHDALTFLLDHLPSNLHLVIATRSDPPLPIARLRGRGQLMELRQADLRFTPDEVTEFLNRVMGLQLAADDVAALATRTEGWIAGLQMAALSMQGREDIRSFIATFTGSQHYILDYLIEEVLQRQSGSTQTFLLQTSILERMTGPLCDTVLEQAIPDLQSHMILEQLEHANLFVVPLDDRQEWYRYHHLFADLLRHRLDEVYPALAPTLHRRASAWYEQKELIAEAVDHALSAADFERAARLIEQAAEPILMRGEIATFLNWAEALPDEMVHARPLLCIYHAIALLVSGRPLHAIESHVQDAMKTDLDGSAAGALAVFRGLLAAYRGDTRQSAEWSQRALELLPERCLFLRSFVAGYLGLNYLYSGDIVPATRAFREAHRIAQAVGNIMNAVLALCHLAELSTIQGQFHEARTFYDQALALAVSDQGHRQPIAGLALIGLGRLLLEWNELEAATGHLIEGIELIRKWGEVAAINGYIGLARIKQAKGDVAGAHEAIEMAQQLAAKFDAMQISGVLVSIYRANLETAHGDAEAVLRWAEGRGLEADIRAGKYREKVQSASFHLYRAFEYITLARLYVVQGRPDDALEILEPLLGVAEAAGWTIFVVMALSLESLALQARGDDAQAMPLLERALSLAEPSGWVRVFVDEGEPMAALLRRLESGDVRLRTFVQKLLASFRGIGSVAPPAEYSQSKSIVSNLRPQPVEPLSERELEVLRLLSADLSSTDIAQELVVSVNTVRSHIKSIYGKLSVHGRYEAVMRARELNLL